MHARALLATGFDFRQDESFQVARDKEAWLKTEARSARAVAQAGEERGRRLKLAGKDDKSIVDVLDKRYDNFLKRLSQVKSADVFQTFMNAYTTAIEPHTNYLGPRAAADFGIQMRLSLVGIGASLTELNEYTTIRELIPGGPASLSGRAAGGGPHCRRRAGRRRRHDRRDGLALWTTRWR